MIVARNEFAIKPGFTEQAMALLKEEAVRLDTPVRIYVDLADPTFTVAVEMEFESMAEQERFSAEWVATPEFAAFFEKWCGFLRGPGCREFWELVK
jgi:hypothetical protein